MFLKSLFALMAGTLIATSAQSAGVLYDCTISDRRKNVDWVSPKLAIIVDKAGKVQVIDGVILAFIQKPISPRARKRGDMLKLDWNISGVYDSKQTRVPTFSYQANLNMKTLAVSLHATPVGFNQRWTGKGTCQKRSAKS